MAFLTLDDLNNEPEAATVQNVAQTPDPAANIATSTPQQSDLGDYTALATQINAKRATKGYKPIPVTGQNDPTLQAAFKHAKDNNYLDTPTVQNTTGTGSSSMTGGIQNAADASSVSTTSTDVSGVQDQTMKVIKGMQDEGLTYAQAFEKYYPRPVANTANEAQIQKQQKAALFADMLRLVTEGVGAAKGANVVARDQRNPYAVLSNKLAQEHALYAKNLSDWQAKGLDAVMKDVQRGSDLYAKNLAAAPKTTTKAEDKSWDRSKFTQTQEQMAKQKELDRENARRIAAGHDATSRSNNAKTNAKAPAKVTQITFADNNGHAVIDNHKLDGVMSAAYQAMLNDPDYMKSGNTSSKEIEAINNDYSFEGKKAKVQEYVREHAHESPKAQGIIKSQASEYQRSTSAAPQAPTFQGSSADMGFGRKQAGGSSLLPGSKSKQTTNGGSLLPKRK